MLSKAKLPHPIKGRKQANKASIINLSKGFIHYHISSCKTTNFHFQLDLNVQQCKDKYKPPQNS